ARAQGGGEGGEILAQSIAPRAIHLLRRQFLCAGPRRRTRGVEPLAARLELLDAECAALIRVDQALDLQPGRRLDPPEAGKTRNSLHNGPQQHSVSPSNTLQKTVWQVS